ncbi:MAG: hypothetical protein AB7L09_02610 [Nitrospira sp.]
MRHMLSKDQDNPILGEFRVGDLVEIDGRVRATTLGPGRIIDIAVSAAGIPVEALVRFEGGPIGGNWYSLRTLKRLADYRDDPA